MLEGGAGHLLLGGQPPCPATGAAQGRGAWLLCIKVISFLCSTPIRKRDLIRAVGAYLGSCFLCVHYFPLNCPLTSLSKCMVLWLNLGPPFHLAFFSPPSFSLALLVHSNLTGVLASRFGDIRVGPKARAGSGYALCLHMPLNSLWCWSQGSDCGLQSRMLCSV